MEMIIVAIISSIAGLIGLVYLDKSFYRRLQWKQDYERSMLKLKKREARKDKKLASTINTTPPATKTDTIKGLLGALDNDTVQGLISRFSDRDDYEEDNELDGLINFAKNNPELVDGFLKGLNKGKKKDDNLLYE